MSSEDSNDEPESDGEESVEETDASEEESGSSEETQQPAQQPQGSAGGALGTPEETQLIKEWAMFVAATFGLAGVGMGVQFFVFNILDEQIIGVSTGGSGGGFGQAFGAALIALPMSLVALAFSGIGITLSVLLGVYFGWNLNVADNLAFKTAAISGGVGTFLLFFLSGFFMGTAVENVSAEIGGLLMNGIGVGIIAAGVAAGGVWVARNQAPTSHGEHLDSPAPPNVNPSD